MMPNLRSLAFMVGLLVLPMAAGAADKARLATEREQVSYMIGMDVAKSLAPTAPYVDLSALESAVEGSLASGKPALDDKQQQVIGQALGQRVSFDKGQPVPGMAPGAMPAAPDKKQVSLLLGGDIARSLTPLKDDLDVPVVMQAIRTSLAGQPLLLTDEEAAVLRNTFSAKVQDKLQAQSGQSASANAAEGKAFLDANKSKKGIFTTPSGLQYEVLRQGQGKRPRPSDHVRVHYEGSLLNGQVFDSSYKRNEPTEFGLNQVIAGWTEGLGLMPVGAKYRFWIPSALGYGSKGTQGIPPNSTLVFDVELLDVL